MCTMSSASYKCSFGFGDVDYAQHLNSLRNNGYNVMLAHMCEIQEDQRDTVETLWNWRDLAIVRAPYKVANVVQRVPSYLTPVQKMTHRRTNIEEFKSTIKNVEVGKLIQTKSNIADCCHYKDIIFA